MLIKDYWGPLLANGHDNCPCCPECGQDLCCERACNCKEAKMESQDQRKLAVC